MPVPCGHVLVHACACLERYGLEDTHNSGVLVPVRLCTETNAGLTVGDPPHFKRPCQETAQPLAIRAQRRSGQDLLSGSCPDCGWRRVVGRTSPDYNPSCEGPRTLPHHLSPEPSGVCNPKVEVWSPRCGLISVEGPQLEQPDQALLDTKLTRAHRMLWPKGWQSASKIVQAEPP